MNVPLVDLVVFAPVQDAFNVPLVIQLTDDEKTLWKGLDINESRRLAREVRGTLGFVFFSNCYSCESVAGEGGWSLHVHVLVQQIFVPPESVYTFGCEHRADPEVGSSAPAGVFRWALSTDSSCMNSVNACPSSLSGKIGWHESRAAAS
eukprot:1161225-Pelagomonas_calceolata.AAC.21